jgi:hypothetical protein
MPTTFFIDRAGNVVGLHLGAFQTAMALENDVKHFALGVSG